MSDTEDVPKPPPPPKSHFADVKAPEESTKPPLPVRIARVQRRFLLAVGLGNLKRRMVVIALLLWGLWFFTKPSVSFSSDGSARPWELLILLGITRQEPGDNKPTWLPHYLIPLFGLLVGAVL